MSFDLDGLDPSIVPAVGTGPRAFYQSIDLVQSCLSGRKCVGRTWSTYLSIRILFHLYCRLLVAKITPTSLIIYEIGKKIIETLSIISPSTGWLVSKTYSQSF